ncbi:hypothetical protein PPACK8108_LOCUS6300 [Phakopsora pachyrhizi]|uniref:Uncharacterized protein n=1 Tax=Phakopsora pachyrhizi TaxID=170000 RepID=A0AAV0AU17_PHAPC|nr:hypothetical protein PPACK8108_LOCUS6300 [Phakopsora pachyrhizi]
MCNKSGLGNCCIRPVSASHTCQASVTFFFMVNSSQSRLDVDKNEKNYDDDDEIESLKDEKARSVESRVGDLYLKIGTQLAKQLEEQFYCKDEKDDNFEEEKEESKVDDDKNNQQQRIKLPQNYLDGGNTKNRKKAINLHEIGPMMELSLIRIKQGLGNSEGGGEAIPKIQIRGSWLKHKVNLRADLEMICKQKKTPEQIIDVNSEEGDFQVIAIHRAMAKYEVWVITRMSILEHLLDKEEEGLESLILSLVGRLRNWPMLKELVDRVWRLLEVSKAINGVGNVLGLSIKVCVWPMVDEDELA